MPTVAAAYERAAGPCPPRLTARRACTRLDFSTPLRRRPAPVASPALVPTEASVSE